MSSKKRGGMPLPMPFSKAFSKVLRRIAQRFPYGYLNRICRSARVAEALRTLACMRTNAAIADPEIEYPPLAQDALGNRLPIPDGTCAWRICRETEGRPREIKGPDKKPARFALTTTIEELVDLCGRD